MFERMGIRQAIILILLAFRGGVDATTLPASDNDFLGERVEVHGGVRTICRDYFESTTSRPRRRKLPNPVLPGCECTGDNEQLGAAERARHGMDYGQWCSAWDDGKCDPTALSGPGHTCEGTHAASCEVHWPKYDFSKDQSWCCDSWCYISNVTCTAELQTQYGITIAKSWTNKDIWFSYDACPDPFSAPHPAPRKSTDDPTPPLQHVSRYLSRD